MLIIRQLIILLKFAGNDFIRWDAAQMLFNAELRRNLIHYQQGLALDFLLKFLPHFIKY